MSKRVRGITIEIDGNVGPLGKALEGVNKQSRDLQGELADISRLLKLDPKNTELLTQKKKLLADAVKVSADRLKTLQTAQEQAARAFAEGKIGEEQYRAIQREVIEATSKLKALEGQLAEVNDRFKQAAEKVGKFGEGLKGAGEKMMPLSIAAGAALGGIAALTVSSAAAADQINMLAKQTGLSTEEIQKFQYASARIDVPLETLTGSMAKLTRNMFAANEQVKRGGDTLTGAALAFNELGVSVTNADGSLRNNQDVMADVIEALAAKTNATERDAYAMAIFGRSAQELNPLILGGADALKEMGLEAEELGLILSQETLDGLNAVDDELEKTKAQLSATGKVMSAEFGEVLLPILKQVTTFIQDITARLRGMDQGTAKIVLGVLALVAVTAPLLIILGQVAMGIGAIIAIVPKFIAAGVAIKTFFFGTAASAGILTKALVALKVVFALATLKITLIIAAVAALAYGVYMVIKHWDTVKAFFFNLWEDVKGFFVAAWEWIKNMFLSYHPYGLIVKHWEEIVEWFKELPGRIGEFLVKLATEIIPYWIGYGMGAMVRLIIEGITTTVDWFRQLPGRVWTFLVELATRVTQQITNIRTQMIEIVRSAINQAVEFFQQFPGRVWTFLLQLPSRILEAGALIRTAMRDIASGAVDRFMDFVSRLPGQVWDALMGLRDIIRNAASALWRAAIDAARSLWDGFRAGLGISSPSYLEEAMARIMETSREMLGQMRGDFRQLGQLRPPAMYTTMPQIAAVGGIAGGRAGGGVDYPRLEAVMYTSFYDAFVDAMKVVGKGEVHIDMDGIPVARALIPRFVTEYQRMGVAGA